MYCPNCGQKLKNRPNYCFNCGQELSNNESKKAPTPNEKKEAKQKSDVSINREIENNKNKHKKQDNEKPKKEEDTATELFNSLFLIALVLGLMSVIGSLVFETHATFGVFLGLFVLVFSYLIKKQKMWAVYLVTVAFFVELLIRLFVSFKNPEFTTEVAGWIILSYLWVKWTLQLRKKNRKKQGKSGYFFS